MKKTEAFAITLIIIFLTSILLYGLAPIDSFGFMLISDSVPVIAAILAVISGLFTYLAFGWKSLLGKVWLLLAGGMLLWFAGEVTWLIYEAVLGIKSPFPSVADIFWLIGYLAIFGSIVCLWRYTNLKPTAKKIVFIFISITAIAVIVGYLLLYPIVIDAEISMYEKFLDMAYPIGDIIVILGALIVPLIFGKSELSKSWKYIASGFICSALGDLLFSYLTWNEIYHTQEFMLISHVTDHLWILGYLIIAYGAYYQKWQLDNA